MRGVLRNFICSFAVFSLMSCGDSGDKSVPLPQAWPRVPIAASDSMATVADVPVEVKINPVAVYEIVEGEHPGLTVRYPSAGVDIYFTFIYPASAKERDEIISARKQRMALNLNGTEARTETLDNVDGVAVVAKSVAQTPVQILADIDGYIVTATSFVRNASNSTPYDSIKPVYDVLEHDMKKAFSR